MQGHYSYGPNFSGTGGFSFTAADLYAFARSLLSGTLINKNSLSKMFTPYHPKQNYGYGCSIETLLGHRCILHNGELSGFRSNITVLIDDDVYIILLSNVLSSWVNDARDALAAIVLGKPYAMPADRVISIDPQLLDEYVGTYDHPLLPIHRIAF